MASQTIPVVDLRDFTSDSPRARQAFIDTLGHALEEIGFFALENHGVAQDLIARAYAAATAFFELDDQTKRRYDVPGLKGQRGFTSFGKEHAKDSNAPDLKEFWHVGRDAANAADCHYVANIWPSEVSAFQPVMQELYRQLDACSDRLLEACSLYLGEEARLLPEMARDGNSVLRIIHYPPIPSTVHPQSVRAAAHEDINFITLLCEATTGGLELLQRDGSWLPIQALRGQIIVDSGDMLQNLSNGLLKSTTHRVVNPDNSRERRFSMPYFVHPRSDVSLSPLARCQTRTGGKPLFPSITAGQYLAQRLAEIGLA